jgi:Mg2+ and Co2+ transporter CorA
MDIKEIMKQCQLTEDELEEYLRLTKDIDHKVDHSRAYRTMMNPIRRNLLKFIDNQTKTLEQITNEFQEAKEQIEYHLSMLEQLFYVMNTKSGWKATPRGIGFLANAIMGV